MSAAIFTRMACYQVIILFFICVLRLSEAFVVPTTRARVIGDPTLLFLAQKDESTTAAFDETDFSQLQEKLPNVAYDVPPTSSILQQQVQTALAPAADFLEDISGGWALSYADLTPNRYVAVLGFSLFLMKIHSSNKPS